MASTGWAGPHPEPERAGSVSAMNPGLPALDLRNPQTVVAAVPHLLGFEPADSLILIWLDATALVLTARADLPQAEADERITDQIAGALLPADALRRSHAVIAVVVTHDLARVASACAVLDRVRAEAERHGIALLDELHVDGDRWRSLICTDPGCCPAAGGTVSATVRADVAMHFALDGRRVLPDRASVSAQVAAAAEQIARTRAALPNQPRRPRRGDRWRDAAIAHAVRNLIGRPSTLPVRVQARIIRDLADVRVRDTVLWDLAQAEHDEVERAAVALAQLTRAAGPEVCAPVATCCAIVAWMTGDGALASAAIDRALTAEPDYGLGRLVAAALRAGWPPQAWRSLLADLDRATCRSGHALART